MLYSRSLLVIYFIYTSGYLLIPNTSFYILFPQVTTPWGWEIWRYLYVRINWRQSTVSKVPRLLQLRRICSSELLAPLRFHGTLSIGHTGQLLTISVSLLSPNLDSDLLEVKDWNPPGFHSRTHHM